ncbi:MAG: dephospho-CoA kinase [Planctomycetota bacterium]|nr:dephospho-CoA kinase [Planctomycetota bacterium]
MNNIRDKTVIGLLGGIGSGKSTVAAELASLGCGCIDADAIGHELLKDPQVRAELEEHWGRGIFDESGNVNRKALAESAFASRQETQALNAIMHPRIRRRMLEQIGAMSDNPEIPAIVIDAALLLETDWHELCNVFIFISTPEDIRSERVKQSRGWDRRTLKRRENLQIPLDIKADKADYVVNNSLSESSLREQIRLVFHRITQVK